MLTLMSLVSILSVLPLMTFSSTTTISGANYAMFVNNISEVQYSIDAVGTNLKGEEAMNGVARNDAQVYNYAAKGATVTDTDGKAWLPYKMANSLSATYISPDTAEEVLGISLPNISVNTPDNTGGLASYFVTRNRNVFIWPPYEYNNGKEDLLYVTTDQYLCEESADGIYVVGQGNPISYEDIDLDDINGIILDGVTVLIDSEHAEPQTSINSITDASVLEKTPAVYYKDTSNAKSPVGLETNEMYKGK